MAHEPGYDGVGQLPERAQDRFGEAVVVTDSMLEAARQKAREIQGN